MGTDAPERLVPPQLLADALGFSPQLLLDDIINAANHKVQDGVNGTEDFLLKRADELGEIEGTQEVEQGLVAFQTLLEFHTDVAFDFFEAWSLRNIFAVSADLPIVLPHHEDVDLTHTPEREEELTEEIKELRNRLENQRRLRRRLQLAIRRKKIENTKAHQRASAIASQEPTVDAGAMLPDRLVELHQSVSTLPKLEETTMAALSQLSQTEAGKRQWETGKSGYMDWAISQLLVKAKEEGGGELLADIPKAELLRRAIAAIDDVSRELENVNGDVVMQD
ncbi:Mis12 protein-domain-containing protein [Mycena crocata]|nr:Mis12 protein-domain-containing protein [Mycena crocata]